MPVAVTSSKPDASAYSFKTLRSSTLEYSLPTNDVKLITTETCESTS